MLLESLSIPVKDLEFNSGQISGVPTNPRIIKDKKFKKLMQSIKDDPEMLSLRELIVFPQNKKFVVLGGNMRLKACIELGYKEVPCKVLNPQLSPETLKAIVMKDNIAYGETDWELLANQWDESDLEYWGMDFPKDWAKGIEETTEPKTGSPVVKLEILFDDLDEYDHARKRILEVIKVYNGVTIKE